ncbi:MAG: uracil-DNA glycosylase [Candidatus Omnitrophica bacterium]|nr:uracil-DNA glycosylase [Candidatus Omnitrophota bacterium]
MGSHKLEELKEEVKKCRKCALASIRHNVVVGEGNEKAKVMFIGEAPGFNEDQKGVPFCGEAGKVLDRLLAVAGLKRGDIYITNILKCRPPHNRDPKKEEIEACRPFLERQLEIIKPEIICTLGNYATSFILTRFSLASQIKGISQIHGKIFEYSDIFSKIKIIPLYHPAVATYNRNMEPVLRKDIEIISKII